jgi:hypothetical protein
MAANIPQMAANGQMLLMQQQQQQQQQQQGQQQQQQQQQQQSKQLHQLVYSSLMQSMGMAPMNSWQSGVTIQDRFAKAITLYDASLFAAHPRSHLAIVFQAVSISLSPPSSLLPFAPSFMFGALCL